ncbi:MAG: FAD-dependent thymidylate synthase [Clostridia bacterium]|nr:FAD-dependent thymidylate synthase [Clostridia bacterium]
MEVELLGGCSQEQLETRVRNVAAAGKLSRFPGNVFEVLESCNDYEKNLKLVKRIIKMGHKSIIEHDYLVFALCDVSPIIEQTIIGNRLTSFTIKSRREVDFRTVGYYIPEFRDEKGNLHPKNEELKEKYKVGMQNLFNSYGKFVDNGISVEDARFLLPYSYHSNIIMGLNARELEKMTIWLLHGKPSKISEAKELGQKLYELIKKHVPYLVDNIEEQLDKEDEFAYLEKISERPEIEILDRPKLVHYTSNADEIVILSNIMYHYQCTKEQAKSILEQMLQKDTNCKEKMMKNILNKEERRELEQVSFTFQIPISLSILTHITRHRMHSLLVPEFTPMWNLNNYIIPDTIKQNEELKKLYIEKAQENIKLYEEFKKAGVKQEDLIYFYIGAQMCNIVTTMNARNVQWICKMRCCNKAQWQINRIAKEIAKQVKEVAPLIGMGLGATCVTDFVCNEGRESCGLINKILENRKVDIN